ncbi:MAG TPA: type II secretion system protein GspM [Hyphomonas sp.]|nr:type II secretion system protein GspM [Hyphomonas sp.]HRK67185.1 type II secretion system protein GspM [Hyphomonas sp.]
MKSAWARLQPREKLLLQLAGIVLTAALVVQAGLVPMIAAGEDARARRVVAEGTIARLYRLQAAGIVQVPQVTDTSRSPEEIAAQIGLALSERSVTPQGHLLFRFDGAEPGVVFSWMDQVEAGSDLRLAAVQMSTAAGGRIDVTAEYTGTRQP